jgi:hypothetical protein
MSRGAKRVLRIASRPLRCHDGAHKKSGHDQISPSGIALSRPVLSDAITHLFAEDRQLSALKSVSLST